jgi:hypothetical protein
MRNKPNLRTLRAINEFEGTEYIRKKAMTASNVTKMRSEYRARWQAYFKSIGKDRCQKCGYDKCWQALEFHHRDPETKVFSPSQATGSSGPNTETIPVMLAEIEKCDLLCACCHREAHYMGV